MGLKKVTSFRYHRSQKRARVINGQDKGPGQIEAMPESSLGEDSSHKPSPTGAVVAASTRESLPYVGEGAGDPFDSEAQQPDPPSAEQQRRKTTFIIKFLVAWVTFVVVLLGIGLLSNLEWARPKVEEQLSSSFHRTVKLGELSWTFGLNGLAIATDRLSMLESDGSPFLVAGRSEIGIAFTPLFRRELIIKHVDFHHPEMYATQLAPGKWNFSDLLVPGPEIRYVEVDDGKLHLRNKITDAQIKAAGASGVFANTKWRSYDFEAVSVKLIFPRPHQIRQWPFYMAFKLPRHNAAGDYISSLSFTLMANGTLDDWQQKKCTVELRGDRMNPDDWRPFFNIPSGVSGLFQFKYRGQGKMSDMLTGDLQCSAANLKLVNSGNVIFTSPNTKCDAKLQFSGKQLSWSDTTINSGGLKITSHGSLNDWKTAVPSYALSLTADLNDLADLSGTSLWKFFPGLKNDAKDPDLKGAAIIEVNMTGNEDDQKIYTSLKANKIPLSHLLSSDAESSTPLLSLFEIEPNAPIKGQIEISEQHKVLLKDVEIPAKGGNLKIHGFIDMDKDEHEVFIGSDDLALNQFDTTQLESSRANTPGRAVEAGKARPPAGVNRQQQSNDSIMLTGKIGFAAHFKRVAKRDEVDVKAQLKNARLTSGKKTLLASGLTGGIVFDGKTIKFNSVQGGLVAGGNTASSAAGETALSRSSSSDNGSFGATGSIAGSQTTTALNTNSSASSGDANNGSGSGGSGLKNGPGAGGTFVLSGTLGVERAANCALQFDGRHVDIGSLIAFSRSAHIPVPDEAVGPMHGTARQLQIGINGKSTAPRISLHIAPEDMTYQLAATASGTIPKPLKITGGSINFADNGLDFKDLALNTASGKLTLTASFYGQPDKLSAKNLRIKTTGIDVAEAQQYLASQTLPADSRKSINSLGTQFGIASMQGRVYGDLSLDMTKHDAKNQPAIEGLVGLNHMSAKLNGNSQPLEHVSGVVTVAGPDLTIQDLHAKFGASHIKLQGDVTKFQTDPQWHLQAIGQIRPQDLMKLVPASSGISDKLNIESTGPLVTKATITGDAKSNKISFNAQCDGNDGLRIRGGYGSFAQPTGIPVTIDATLLTDSGSTDSVSLQHCNLAIGDSVFQASGKYQWAADAGAKAPPNVQLDFNTPDAVPMKTVMQVLSPDCNADGVAGTVKVTLAIAGDMDNLSTHGDAILAGVTVPGMLVKDLNGHVHTPRWSIVPSSQSGTTGDTTRSEARIDLSSVTFGAIPIHALNANIVVENGGSEPKISINSGTASIAGGKVNINASYGTQTTKWHLDLALQQLQVDKFVTDLIEHSGEITGLADGKISLDSSGNDYNQNLRNLQGNGELAVYKGTVPKVGQLQEKLTQANLLQQGIFGFNVNNVLQSVLPVKTGKFSEASTSFEIADGIINVDRMIFDGNDLRLRAAGTWNLPLNSISMEVDGNIPRVSSSILPGAVGEVSRNFTLQKAVRVMTFNKLENLPSLPILGDIGTDDPRAFTFKIAGVLNSSDAVTHSIQKSFKWLPNKPNASAHPIPGLNLDINLKPSAWLHLLPPAVRPGGINAT